MGQKIIIKLLFVQTKARLLASMLRLARFSPSSQRRRLRGATRRVVMNIIDDDCNDHDDGEIYEMNKGGVRIRSNALCSGPRPW